MSDESLRYGAYVNLVCHPDLKVARRLASKTLPTYARFSMMHPLDSLPLPTVDATALANLNSSFDMREHNNENLLTPAFIDEFAIVGCPNHCVGRLQSLVALGITKIVVVGARDYLDPEARESEERFVRNVLPLFVN